MTHSSFPSPTPTFEDQLGAQLAALAQQNLLRSRRTVQSPQRPHVKVDGREMIAFCSNDYLGLAADPRLIAAACEGAQRYGVGSGASHLILGHSAPHAALEEALAQFVNLPRALLFSTGYMANIGIITALAGRDAAVFADRLNHASLNDAILLSRADFKRYAHADLDNLEKLLVRSQARRKLVVTDAVFSMDGDIAPIAGLLGLCERYDAALVIDDAHGFGVLGESGGGVLQHLDIASPRIVYMATLGKAAGVCGAFVAGTDTLIETLMQRARTYIYTTALPPLLAQAVLASLDIIGSEPSRRACLVQRVTQLKNNLSGAAWPLAPSATAIQPLIVGENAAALHVAAQLAERGLLVPAIRPPTVPQGTARLRISLSAAHSEDDVARLTSALVELGKSAAGS